MKTTRPSPSSLEDIATITPTFILGMALILAGASIRFLCFREMGVHFTFQISLREKHKLVRTGPYSIVRHPAYTGGHMTILGGLLTLTGHGSWLYCGAGYSEKIGRVLCGNYCASVMVLAYALLRGAKEDVYLRREFEEEWEEWARDVPYMYIPFVV
ncbi:uncharacterized protein STEHIDRAFT_58595 [Stereum hirsutum FP-91666 SS1]|uniref:uncharacterized protein n=1 Tax=Stereum hirsutum (strain FP-91666) TaxID=721885 RepID=UPI000444A92F|nr:uncharacterized protein STEHIDRAFT_58595 [Stereum hirsutum FP-91666 SS1]EIM86326.1 hypothetical protein STEHIDRAFT_58595 [Stereum hirsutum FP-91666 SS1]